MSIISDDRVDEGPWTTAAKNRAAYSTGPLLKIRDAGFYATFPVRARLCPTSTSAQKL